MSNEVKQCHELESNQEHTLSILTADSLSVKAMNSFTFTKACIVQGLVMVSFWSYHQPKEIPNYVNALIDGSRRQCLFL